MSEYENLLEEKRREAVGKAKTLKGEMLCKFQRIESIFDAYTRIFKNTRARITDHKMDYIDLEIFESVLDETVRGLAKLCIEAIDKKEYSKESGGE